MLKNLSAWRLLSGSVQTGATPPRRAFVLALLDIYKRYGVYIGGQLEYADLVKDWPASGFRRGDLEAGLDEAVDAGLLKLSEGPGEPTVSLLSTDLPPEPSGTFARRLRHQAAGRTLQVQRSLHRSGATDWNGENRRRSAGAALESGLQH
ncbi:MAG: hypothetical protein JWQ90_1588 [Hydrocarboniphaga sp.]|uniref:hypothetical protein n=1 Tax=Hydrocarboniphaga sp. TaxID=2033016 RepID=UPI00261EA569|nr:hypothetical protein [Hydrocarboniphaga sp.]MDB5969138.1 hypothetical protein [Hydrocarboniphaga sp.]